MLSSLVAKVEKLSQQLSELQRTNTEDVIFDSQDVCRILNISKRTLADWRSSKIISYSQIGKKFFYRKCDITTLISNNYYPSSDNYSSFKINNNDL